MLYAFLLFLLLNIPLSLVSAVDPILPQFSVTQLSQKQELKIDNQGFSYPVEITPIILPQPNGDRLYIFPSSRTWLCRSPGNLLGSSTTNPLHITSDQCSLVSKPSYLNSLNAQGGEIYAPPPADISNAWLDDWRRTYDGILDAQVVNTATGTRLVVIRHGEHANAKFGDYNYQGSVYPNILVSSCFSGYNAGLYQQCWESFAGFSSIGWFDYNATTGWNKSSVLHDEGPIIWPSRSYKNTDGTRNGAGFYQPSIFSTNEYLYHYSLNSLPDRSGAQCMVASRAPLTQGGKPGTWRNFTDTTDPFVNNSLPTGFPDLTTTLTSAFRSFYATNGNKMDCIFPEEKPSGATDAAIWFKVAKVRNSSYYIGAEEISPNYTSWKIGLRLSKDLVHWSPLMQAWNDTKEWNAPDSWGFNDSGNLKYKGTEPLQNFTYPTFLDKYGNTSYEVDADEFYLLGNHANNRPTGYQLYAMKLRLDLPVCTDLSAVAPQNLKISKGTTVDTYTFSWDAMPNASYYSIRINDLTTNTTFGTDCVHPLDGDMCNDIITETTYSATLRKGHIYDWWVHGRSICDGWSKDATQRGISISPADVNSDFSLNGTDFSLFITNLFSTQRNKAYDIDSNGAWNIFDYNKFIEYYTQSR